MNGPNTDGRLSTHIQDRLLSGSGGSGSVGGGADLGGDTDPLSVASPRHSSSSVQLRRRDLGWYR
ncbi:MAG: hypothetical protein AAFX94_21330 [Myxococcota bacterium]